MGGMPSMVTASVGVAECMGLPVRYQIRRPPRPTVRRGVADGGPLGGIERGGDPLARRVRYGNGIQGHAAAGAGDAHPPE